MLSLVNAIEQGPELVTGQVAHRSGRQPAEGQRPERRATQLAYGVTGRVEQPPHDAIAAHVDVELDQRASAGRVLDEEPVDLRRPVVELDPGLELGAEAV